MPKVLKKDAVAVLMHDDPEFRLMVRKAFRDLYGEFVRTGQSEGNYTRSYIFEKATLYATESGELHIEWKGPFKALAYNAYRKLTGAHPVPRKGRKIVKHL